MAYNQSNGEPISILKMAQDKVTIDTRAIKGILEKIGNHNFAIYSINGPKRTGKSFMLSNFIRFLNQGSNPHGGNNDWVMKSGNMTNFAWRGGADRKTVGIDVWSEPFWTTTLDGRRIAVILMDTQGSFDDKTTLQQNAIIFAISTLLSSVLIFNIMRDVGEDVLQFFQFFSSFATLTIPEVEDGNNDGRGAGAFQKLVFLIRDFQFVQDYEFGFYDDKHVPQGQAGRGKNYKKDKLDSNSEQPAEVRFTHDQVVKSYQVFSKKIVNYYRNGTYPYK